MDEEELEQPSSKINVGSFFERVDSVEKVANNALSRANANLGIINNQKLIINSLSVSIEAMQTKIRDIANYIIIEKKLERDVEEDRAIEERDRLQKQAMVERATTIMGEPGPQGEPGQPAEKQKGSSLLGTLLRLGIGAFAIKFLWPALLPLLKGVLAGIVKSIFSWTTLKIAGLFGAIIGSIPLLKRFGPPAAEKVKNFLSPAVQLFDNLIKGIGKDGKVGEVSGGNDSGGQRDFGEGYKESEEKAFKEAEDYKKSKVSKSNLEFEDSMSDTLEDKDLKKKTFKVTTGKKNKTLEDLEREYEAGLAKVQKMKDEGRNVNKIEFEQDKVNILKNVIDMKKAEMGLVSEEDKAIGEAFKKAGMGQGESSYSATTEYRIVEPIKSGKEELDLSSNNVDGDMTQAIAKTNERIDNIIGGENKEQNNGNLVSANKPNVTEATLKLAAAPLPFVKVIKNNQLSTSPKSYNGLPPEIAAMIS